MSRDSIASRGLSEEIVSAYLALSTLHRAFSHQSNDSDEKAANDYQSDILDREARIWSRRLSEAARRAEE